MEGQFTACQIMNLNRLLVTRQTDTHNGGELGDTRQGVESLPYVQISCLLHHIYSQTLTVYICRK